MTAPDFAKEARDLGDRLIGDDYFPTPPQDLDRIETLARRIHEAGLAEGLARAADPFSGDELHLIREWFNAVTDLSPQYLNDADRALSAKIEAILSASPQT